MGKHISFIYRIIFLFDLLMPSVPWYIAKERQQQTFFFGGVLGLWVDESWHVLVLATFFTLSCWGVRSPRHDENSSSKLQRFLAVLLLGKDWAQHPRLLVVADGEAPALLHRALQTRAFQARQDGPKLQKQNTMKPSKPCKTKTYATLPLTTAKTKTFSPWLLQDLW